MPRTFYDFFHEAFDNFDFYRDNLPRHFWVSVAPSIKTTVISVLASNMLFVCWGIYQSEYKRNAVRRAWTHIKLRIILKNVKVIVVNDLITFRYIRRYHKICAEILPYPIDTEFFSPQTCPNKKYDLICLGNNDRDEKVILSLADAGYKVCRISRDQKVQQFYFQNSHKKIDFYFSVGFEEVRRLVSASRVAVLPIMKTGHCAGQSAAIEILAQGLPIVTSSLQLRYCISERQNIKFVKLADIDNWISEVVCSFDSVKSSSDIREIHSFNACADLYRKATRT